MCVLVLAHVSSPLDNALCNGLYCTSAVTIVYCALCTGEELLASTVLRPLLLSTVRCVRERNYWPLLYFGGYYDLLFAVYGRGIIGLYCTSAVTIVYCALCTGEELLASTVLRPLLLSTVRCVRERNYLIFPHPQEAEAEL